MPRSIHSVTLAGVVAFALAGGSPARGQGAPAGAIAGQVVDAHDGTPYPVVEVRVVGPDGERRVVSGEDGRFELHGLPAGRYRLELVDPGLPTARAVSATMPEQALDLSHALEIPGYGNVQTHAGHIYVTASGDFTITRYEMTTKLEAGKRLSLADRGFTWVGESMFLDAERAFLMNGDQLKIIEWNPSTMTINREYDISGMAREGWGNEERGSFLRASDGKIFFYWNYNNDRIAFVNSLVVGVFDIATAQLTVLEDEECSASAGFGGFFAEAGDLYLIADNFGGFTRFGKIPDPKTACVVRIRKDATDFDPEYRWKPAEAMGGLELWGLYYAGNGVAYTTGVDPAELNDYGSVFEFIFAPIHGGWTLDLAARSATSLPDIPPDGVGFDSVRMGDELLIPRSTGTIKVYDVDNVDTTVYALDGETRATRALFSMPGYLTAAARLR